MTPHEQLSDAARSAPPLTVAGLSMAGITLSDWVLIITIIYTVLQLIVFVLRLARSQKKTDRNRVRSTIARHENSSK